MNKHKNQIFRSIIYFFIKCNFQTCSEYQNLAQAQARKWQKILQHERSQKLRLEEMVEQLARQHSLLEQAAKGHRLTKPSKFLLLLF